MDKLTEDSTSAVIDFVDEFGLTFPVLLDGGDDVNRRFEVRGLPATFFIDRDGVLRAKNLGPVFGNLLPDGIAAADAAGRGRRLVVGRQSARRLRWRETPG